MFCSLEEAVRLSLLAAPSVSSTISVKGLQCEYTKLSLGVVSTNFDHNLQPCGVALDITFQTILSFYFGFQTNFSE